MFAEKQRKVGIEERREGEGREERGGKRRVRGQNGTHLLVGLIRSAGLYLFSWSLGLESTRSADF